MTESMQPTRLSAHMTIRMDIPSIVAVATQRSEALLHDIRGDDHYAVLRRVQNGPSSGTTGI